MWSATALPDGPVPLGQRCAVSVLAGSGQERDEQQRRRLTGLVGRRHESLAAILAVVPLAEGFAVVSERVDGPTLAVLRVSRSGLSRGEVAALLRPLADGLARLHSLGLTHGDVSPANVVLAAAGRPVLVDLAGDVAFEAGTAGFIAPERALGTPAGPSSDVWSLAMTAVWLADGADRGALQDALAPALTSDPRVRCTSRELAALALGLGAPDPVLVPSAASLAQGSLRARAAIEETRLAATRRRRPVRRGSGRHRGGWVASSRSWGRLKGGGAALCRVVARRRRDRRGATPGRPRRPVGRPRGAVLLAVLFVLAGGVVGGAFVAERAQRVAAPADAAASPAPQGDRSSSREARVLAAVSDLLAARDSALNSGDGRRLARLSVAGSPAAAGDAALVELLASGATAIAGLHTTVNRIQVLDAADDTARVRVVSRQSAHVRTGAHGPVQVPEQPERCADLRLAAIGASWLLQDVAPCPAGQPG